MDTEINISAEKVMELYNEKKYDELMDKMYLCALDDGVRMTTEKLFTEDFITLKFLCFAAYLAGYYYDCLVLIKKLFSFIPLEDPIYEPKDRVYFAECALESFWYCYINNITVCKDCDLEQWINRILDLAPNYYDKCNQEKRPLYDNVKKIFELSKNGHVPYYSTSFFVPFSLNFEKYTFNLADAPPFKEMTAEQEVRGSVEGTKFSVVIEGFVKADSWWKGPIWKDRQELIVAIPALNIVNRLLLIIAEGDTKDFVPRIRPEQLSSIDIHQYMGNGDSYHFCNGSMFGAQFIRKWFQRSPYEQSELQKLNQLLIETYNYPLYATLFHQAQNTMNAGLYEESIMLFFSCIEATVHYWCGQLVRATGLEKDYEDFEESKHVCRNCSLYQQDPKAKGVSSTTLPPSIRMYPRFLKKCKIINNDQEKRLLKLIIQSQNDSLRNELMHGKIERVNLLQVKGCQKNIQMMNEFFASIMKKFE